MSIVYAATAMNAELDKRTNVMPFDSDSAPIGVDNRCTACISHIAEDFIGNLVDSKRTIKGFGGSRTAGIKMGTLRWSWLDNAGIEHTFKIPNSYYVPQGKVRLLSPQHWAKYNKSKGGKKGLKGTLSQTTSDTVTLIWNERKSKLTIPLSKESNVATFQLAPGYENYYAFCADAGIDTIHNRRDPLICSPAIEIKDMHKDNLWNENPISTPFHDEVKKYENKTEVIQASEGEDKEQNNQHSITAEFL